jgi:hypothetical protein
MFDRLTARLIRASRLVDAGYRLFDRARSRAVAVYGTDGVLSAYNDLAYGGANAFKPGSTTFRGRLFHWEEEVAAQVFPRAPSRLLVGGAGGGREALAWAEAGYEVVAFEPAPALAQSMAAAIDGRAVRPLVGRYEDLPRASEVASGRDVDVTTLGPYGAAIFGWASYSHVRGRAARVSALRRMAALTSGPVVLSFYVHARLDLQRARLSSRLARAIGLKPTGDAFSPEIGYYHWSTREEIESEIAEAGLDIVASSYDDNDGRWPWIAARRRAPTGP